MLVNQRDIVSGTGDQRALGVTSAAAARRELTGKRYPLLNANASRSGPQGLLQQQPGASGGASAREE